LAALKAEFVAVKAELTAVKAKQAELMVFKTKVNTSFCFSAMGGVY
jgi:hypothetical protein